MSFYPETDYASPWDTSYDNELNEYEEDQKLATARRTKKVDPFAVDTAEEETTTVDDTKENDTVTENNTDERNQNEITLTFKAGSGFEVPWIVIRTPDLESANDILTEAELLQEVMQKTARAGVFFGSQMPSGGTNSGSGGSGTPAARPARQEAPGGDKRFCQHGEMEFKSGSKNGKTWQGFFCPTPRGTADQCSPQFLR